MKECDRDWCNNQVEDDVDICLCCEKIKDDAASEELHKAEV